MKVNQLLNEVKFSPRYNRKLVDSYKNKISETKIGIEFELILDIPEFVENVYQYDESSSMNNVEELTFFLIDFFAATTPRETIIEAVDVVLNQIIKKNSKAFNNYLKNYKDNIIEELESRLGSREAAVLAMTSKSDDFLQVIDLYYKTEFIDTELNLFQEIDALGLDGAKEWHLKFGFEWPYKEYDEEKALKKVKQEFSQLERVVKAEILFGNFLTDYFMLDYDHDDDETYSYEEQKSMWSIVSDESIEDDQHGVNFELVSPPLFIGEGLKTFEQLLNYLHYNDYKTNSSTGLHINISLPSNLHKNIDYLKLGLFLGDKYILSVFDRESNEYAASYIDTLSDLLADSKDDTTKMLNNLKKYGSGIEKTLTKTLLRDLKDSAGLDSWTKYQSINIKNSYIEFRSPGGDYLSNIDSIFDTIYRILSALIIASDESLYKKEYAKKLYKMLSGEGSEDKLDEFMKILALYKSNVITSEKAKQLLGKK